MSHLNKSTNFDLTNHINILVYSSFFSPIILPSLVLFSSLFTSSIRKGLVYLFFLIFFCFFRSYFYGWNGGIPTINDGTLCTSIQYSKYGNSTFSSFVFSFTIIYILTPMYFYQSVNYELILGLVSYSILDFLIRSYKKCIINTFELIKNIFVGAVCSFFVVLILSNKSLNTSKFLFFNETSSNKEMCTTPSTQTFKCNFYKDGEIVGSL